MRKFEPKISVIMSVYNEEKNISKSIKSVLSQNYRNFELLIFDDCSNDNTVNILRKFLKKSKKIKCFFNKKNIGLTKALNFLIKKSKGKYIARIDGDDLWFKNKLKIQYNCLKKNNLFLVGSNCFFKKNNKIVKKSNLPLTYKDIKKCIFFYNPIIHSSVLFKKYNKTKFYDENFTKCQDYAAWVKCVLDNKVMQNVSNHLVAHDISRNFHISTLINTFKVKINILKKIKKPTYLIHIFVWFMINFIKFAMNKKTL
tara:strand:- start:26 stop:793 length:768 start_codon:yes stop_codon:yes gene_type:complete